ncbi:MAG: M67 family metallopeptidase [Candidatus Heimdallarchaeota archaeon]
MIDVETIVIPRRLFDILVNHAKESRPYESVSIIAGNVKDNIATAEFVYTPENIEKSTVTFTVDPIILLDIYTEVEKKGKYIIGIYHTHPAPPKPSATDIDFMQVNPYVWLISSTSNPENPKGYILENNNSLRKVEIMIKNEE